MTAIKLTGKTRKVGNGNPKRIRRDGGIPVVVYGNNFESVSAVVDYKEFTRLFQDAGEATLIDLVVGDETFKVLIKDMQYDFMTDKVSHIDFYKVDLKEKVEADVPVTLEGEPELVVSGEGMVLSLLNEITVEALPLDLPAEFVVDVSGLVEVGDMFTVADLVVDKNKVEIKHEDDEVIAKLDYAEIPEEEEEEEEVLEEVEIEITKEKAIEEREEGREPAKEEELEKGQKEGKEEIKPTESRGKN